MSIERLYKVTLYGLAREKEQTLEGLQTLGCLHLVSLRRRPAVLEAEPAPRAYQALKYLRDAPRKRRQVHTGANFDSRLVAEQALANQRLTRQISDERDFLEERIRQLEPWGDFVLPPAEALAGLRLWFYVVRPGDLRRLPAEGLVWQVVHQGNLHAYVVVIAATEPEAHVMPVPRTHTGALSLGELRLRLEAAEIRLEELAAEREALTRWIYLLSRNLAHLEDLSALEEAAAGTLDSGELFAVQGWLPESRRLDIETFARERGLALVVEVPAAEDRPPTLLHNNALVAGGEDVVGFYQTPGYRAWDPSTVVFFSFALFFAMILGDAGYAALLGGTLALYWRRLGRSVTGRRMRVLSASVVGASLLYGVMVGSYFGVSPASGTLLAALRVLDFKDYDNMMTLSICIGAAHLVLANTLAAWHASGMGAKAAPLGWIAMLGGGLMLWLAGAGPGHWGIAGVAGLVLMAGGALAVLAYAGARPVHRPMDALRRLVDGLLSLGGVTKMFGDVLSYLRLFALGLASASLAVTFNRLAGDVATHLPGMGLLASLLILGLGHALNLALAVMSGLVHGLRLNLIEFFNWGVSAEGYPFRCFAKREVEE
jgi:V/A-type H+-transporting ATPase subunit I